VSRAFFSTPGTERLYSGVTMMTASDDSIEDLKAAASAGMAPSLSAE
jgi:hypothetical protein